MSLNKKKSRTITVKGIKYRFQVSKTLMDDLGNYNLNLTIQLDGGIGACLIVKGLITRDYWLDFSDLNPNDYPKYYPIIMPKHVARVIHAGQEMNWQPGIAGKPFHIKMSNEELFGVKQNE